MRVLAIETSCDETAAAVVEGTGTGKQMSGGKGVRVLSSVVASQASLHERTGGVVPEVAARAHAEAVTFVIGDALHAAVGRKRKTAPEWTWAARDIDAVAVTTEPGLRPALVVGEAAARAIAVAWDKPLLPVNHLAGHIAAAWLVSEIQLPVVHRFPAVALVVSGGHTQLWRVSDLRPPTADLRLLGQTRDDAAGEAFDKIARLLGLLYPGGAALSKLAKLGDTSAFSFPRPMMDSGDHDFSFSGLKTAVFYEVRNRQLSDHERADVAASAQAAIVEVLVAKTSRAAAQERAAEVILTGGVAANTRLRARLKEVLDPLPLVVPHRQYCTDNAAMIGAAAVLGVRVPSVTSLNSSTVMRASRRSFRTSPFPSTG